MIHELSPPCIHYARNLFLFLLWILQLLRIYHSQTMLPYISLYISTYAQEQMFLHAGFLCVGWPGFRKCICNFRSESNVLPDCLSEGYADASVLHWFLFLRILTNTWLSDGFKMELIVVIYVFLITNKVGHLMCLLAVGFSFSVSCVFISSPIILLV